MEIRTETKDNGSWSQYLDVGVLVEDAFGEQVFRRKGYVRSFEGLEVHRKTEGRGASQRTRWLIGVPEGFPWAIRLVTNAGGQDRPKDTILYMPPASASAPREPHP